MLTADSKCWEELEGKLDPAVFDVLRRGIESADGSLHEVYDGLLRYLVGHVLNYPWANHLALVVGALAHRRCDYANLRASLWLLHPRLKVLFAALGLKDMQEWQPEKALPGYLRGQIVPDDTPTTRIAFVQRYNRVAREVQRWLDEQPGHEQARYKPFALREVYIRPSAGVPTHLEVFRQQRATHRAQIDALVPHLLTLQEKAQRRYHRLVHLYQAYRQAREQLRLTPDALPVAFSYEEDTVSDQGIPVRERLLFRIWNRRSFVMEHAEAYQVSSVREAQLRKRAFAPERDDVFVEFVRAETDAPQPVNEALWFAELLRRDVLGRHTQTGDEAAIAEKQAWLRSWGYGVEDETGVVAPFKPGVPGLLLWSNRGGMAKFMATAQGRAEGLLVPVEALYAGATFGLLALHLFASVGIQMSEALQIQLTDSGLVAAANGRCALRVIPGRGPGDAVHDYRISEATVSLLRHMEQVLREHYSLAPDAALPPVAFDKTHSKAHLFTTAPYLFQYAHTHLPDRAIAACLRFLLHGIVIRTADGKPIVPTASLLRDAYMAHAVEVDQVPPEIVGGWLHQKRIPVSIGSSAATQRLLDEAADHYLSRTQVRDIARSTIVRLPSDIQRLYDELRGRVGGGEGAA